MKKEPRRRGRGDVAALREELERNLQDLSERLKRGAYRAKAGRRVLSLRPTGGKDARSHALEEKSSSARRSMVLNAIYETDFLGFPYGFRPGRSQHQARMRSTRDC